MVKSYPSLYAFSHHMPVRLKDSPKVQRTRLQYASWLGNTTSLLIVVDNDMFIKQSPYEETDNRITNTGQPELIYNGIPDWLYQGKTMFPHHIYRAKRIFSTPLYFAIIQPVYDNENLNEMRQCCHRASDNSINVSSEFAFCILLESIKL